MGFILAKIFNSSTSIRNWVPYRILFLSAPGASTSWSLKHYFTLSYWLLLANTMVWTHRQREDKGSSNVDSGREGNSQSGQEQKCSCSRMQHPLQLLWLSGIPKRPKQPHCLKMVYYFNLRDLSFFQNQCAQMIWSSQ